MSARTWAVLMENGQPVMEGRRPIIVEVTDNGARVTHWPGQIGRSATLQAPFGIRGPRNAAERKAVEDQVRAMDYAPTQLTRWAERAGRTVEWGNVIGSMRGQSFRETFATEAQAIERVRQALDSEAIDGDRAPVATTREDIRS